MRHYFNLDGARVIPTLGCDDGVFGNTDPMGGARIFAEARVPDAGCDDPVPDTSNPYGEGEASWAYCSRDGV